MSKGNKGNQPERELEADANRALRTFSLNIEDFEAYYARRSLHCTCLELNFLYFKIVSSELFYKRRIVVYVTSELKTRAIEHLKNVEHNKHETDLKF
jgi:hypothetical protein